MTIDALWTDLEQARRTWMGIYNMLSELSDSCPIDTKLVYPAWAQVGHVGDDKNNFSFNLFVDNSNIGNFDGLSDFTQLHATMNQLTTHLAILLPWCFYFLAVWPEAQADAAMWPCGAGRCRCRCSLCLVTRR
jgi:hypothetical protein